MKAVAYGIRPFEKEFLAKANQKKHDITLISNALSVDTAIYAEGKDAVIVFPNDDVSEAVIKKLAGLGVKYIASRSAGIDHINKAAAARYHIKLAHVAQYSPHAIAEHTVAMAFALNRHLVKADQHSHRFDFRNDELVGFNFSGKTVGLIGLGNIGRAVALIFNGMGCRVVAFDPKFPKNILHIQSVTLGDLLASSDIISLHLPLSNATRYLIRADTIRQMKNGVMLINTSRGAIINTWDVLAALETGKVGYLGLDVYEYEKGLFFEDHEDDLVKDTLMKNLLGHPNVLITPHQAYLTNEALREIANQTIKNLDLWQMKECLGKSRTCAKDCLESNLNETQNDKLNDC